MDAHPCRHILTIINTSISSILLSRFLLDLRSVYTPDTRSQNTSLSSVRFASQIVGNLGAPLEEESAWSTNAADHVPEPITISDDPLAEGLISRQPESTNPVSER